MRIALTTDALRVGGLETFIFSLAGALGGTGHEVHIVATDERGDWFDRAPEVGARAHFIDGLGRRSRARHGSETGAFLARNAFDAVINNNSWFVQASLGMLPAHTRTISVIHNSFEPVVALACANEPACDAFVAPSQATADLARRRVRVSAKIRLITHGIEVSETLPLRPILPKLRVVFCGRLEHVQKGIFLLPGILKRVADSGVELLLELLGDGPDREPFARLFQEQNLSRHVIFLGRLRHEETLERIGQADALILPSFFEGLPLAPLEAMARGTIPVLSLLQGITDTIVEDGISGFLVKPGDIDGFSAALIRLARDPELRRRMSLASWKAARERFSLARTVGSYRDLLEELRLGPARPQGLPALAPEMVRWKDRIPNPVRRRLQWLRRRF